MNSVIEHQQQYDIHPTTKFEFDVIPKITDPLGKHWKQPDMSKVGISETYALMTLQEFNQLLDYSGSQPSGTYIGKCWKTFRAYRMGVSKKIVSGWHLVWFSQDPNPKYLKNNYRLIVISGK